jgi:hypothetical protein
VKNWIAIFALSLTASAYAGPPEWANNPDCASNQACGPSQGSGSDAEIASIPAPGTLALIGLGLTGLVLARKNKK